MTSPALLVEYPGGTVRVETDDAADLEWLCEFVLPDFEPRSAAEDIRGASRIVMLRDRNRFEEMLRAEADPSRPPVACFSLDGRMESLPRWRSPNDVPGTVVVFDGRIETFLRRDATNGDIEIVARPHRPAARIALLRALREIASARLPDQACVLHSAALAWNGCGIVIAGSKNAGKTTLLLHLLSRTGASFLANDRSTVRMVAGTPHVRGMPTIAHIRGSSVENLPHLSMRFLGTHAHHRFSLSETNPDKERPNQPSAWSLTPAQLTHLLEVPRSGEVPLSALLFPRKTERPGGMTVELLSKNDAQRRLQDAVFSSGQQPMHDAFFPASNRAARVDWLESVRCFDCALGVDAYREDGAHRLLEVVTNCAVAR